MSGNYITSEKGLWSWMKTLDHKRIGVMYLFTILTFFLIGGLFAVAIRIQLAHLGKNIVTADQYNKLFTYHGAIMVFLVVIPAIPAALGNFALPLLVGAKDVAFPRLNLFSYYLYIIGALVACSSLLVGGADTGWTFYTPYALKTGVATLYVVAGAFIAGFSSVLTGLNFIVTINKLRAPGLTAFRLPLFCWSIYATSIIQVLATPVLAITLLLLIMERVMKIGVFDASLGGDPVLFQHFFWFYSHPAVYIMILPAMGIISEIVPVFSRKPIFGYKAIAYSSLGIAAISFLVWGHHMFVSGQSKLANFVFSLLTMLVAVPTGIKVFSWVATMYKGSIRFQAPMLYAFGFLELFTIGGLTGIYCATIAIDVHLTDTYFIVAHFHYVMVGGTLMGLLAGMHYWFPKMTGRMYSEVAAFWAWLFIVVGFNLTFFPQFILGSQGMPRRYYDYPAKFTYLNRMSSFGTSLVSIGFFMVAIYLIYAIKKGKIAPSNPWNGLTLEWQTTSPPPTENFEQTPVVKDWFYEYRSKA